MVLEAGTDSEDLNGPTNGKCRLHAFGQAYRIKVDHGLER